MNGNTEMIDQLVSKKALDDMDELNGKLASSYTEMEKLLVEVQKLSTELSAPAKSYIELAKAIEKVSAVEKEKQKIEQDVLKTEQEKEKLRQEVLKTEVQSQKVTQESQKVAQEKLKTDVQGQKVAQEKIKTAQAEATAAERKAKADKKADDVTRSATGSINKMRQEMAVLVIAYNRADAAARERLAPGIRKLQESINAANAAIGRSQGYVGQYERALGGLAGAAKKLIAAFGLIGGVMMFVNVMKDFYSTVVDFEQANVNLATVLGRNVKEITALTDSAKKLGATTEWSASKVTELQTELAKLGFDENQILNMQKPILNFATAMDADLAEAATLAGAALTAFGMKSLETERAVSVMTVGANKSALSFEYMQTALSTVAPVAKAFGFSIEDVTALLGTLSNAGFDASSAATATRNILLNLADTNGKLAKEMGKPVKTIPELASALTKLRERGINLADALELTDKRSVAAFNTFIDGADALVELRGQLEDTGDELQRIADERLDTAAGAAKTLQSAWEGLMLTFSESTGTMKSVIEGLTGIVNWVSRAIKAADDYNKVPTETSWYKNIIQENREAATNQYTGQFSIAANSIQDKDDKDGELRLAAINDVYRIERAKIIPELNEYEDQFDKLMANRERSINAGIIKADEWSKSDAKLYNDLKLNIDTYTASIESLNMVYQEFTKTEADSSGNGLGLGDEKAAEKAKKEAERAAAAAKKERERRTKELAENIESLGLIEAFRLKKSAEINKGIADDDKKTFDERRAASEAALADGISAIEKQRDAEINAVDERLKAGVISEATAANQRVLITEKALYEISKLELKHTKNLNNLRTDEAELELKHIKEGITARAEELNEAMQNELVIESNSYAERMTKAANSEQKRTEITREYARKRLEIIRKYNQMAFKEEVEQLNAAIDKLDLSEEVKSELRRKVNEMQKRNTKDLTEYEIKMTEDKVNDMLEKEGKFNAYLKDKRTQAVMSIWETTLDVMNTYYDAQISRIDELEKKEKERYDERLKMIDENLEAGLMSEETADAKRREIEEEQAQREKDFEQQRKEMQRRQAVWQKAEAIVQTTINTAQAISSALTVMPTPLGIVLAAIVGAMGAAQIAMIASQSVPAYAKGTKDHSGGFARVGDGGRPEMVILPSGEVWKTPAVDTFAYLPKGTEVLPDFKTALANMLSRPVMAVYDDNRGDTVFLHDEVLRRDTGEMRSRLDAIGRSVEAIRANSIYSERKAGVMYRLNRISRSSHGH